MSSAYIVATAAYFPGAPVDNDAIDRYIAPLSARCDRLKRRILAENGITTRHYALDASGRSTHTAAGMAARALSEAMTQPAAPMRLDFLSAACTGPDVAVPGFANMVQGEARLPPLKTASLQGVCASSVSALDYAVHDLRSGSSRSAAVVAAEFPSRMFKASRIRRARDIDFDAHFLRWMLSDGAGAWLLADRPAADGISLRVDFVHLKSFSGDYPTCMQVGMRKGNDGPGYLDFETLDDAEAQGAYLLRQDVRMLPNLFDVAIHEYAALVRDGVVQPERIEHFLAHYSSGRFREVVAALMEKAGLAIPERCWYSNLAKRGNVGAASIVTMLADFMRERSTRPGERMLMFVPESGRFSVGFVGLTVVDASDTSPEASFSHRAKASALASSTDPAFEAPPTMHADRAVEHLLQQLLGVWHTYRSDVLRTPIARRVLDGTLTVDDYLHWIGGWVGQVREGTTWMRAAAQRLPATLAALKPVIEKHATEEQDDWRVLFADYRAAGGNVADPDRLHRNPGAEALCAYMHRMALCEHPEALLGAMYIIEGTGNRIVPTLLPRIREALGASRKACRFLEYHGMADVAHMRRWLDATERVVTAEPASAQRVVDAAQDTALLYALSWRHALDAQPVA